jgi:hypothetical protein
MPIYQNETFLLFCFGLSHYWKLPYTQYEPEYLEADKESRGSVVGWGTMLQAGRLPVRVSDEVDFFSLPNPSSRTMALGSTQPLTEMSTRNLPGRKKRTERRANNRMSENVIASTSRNPTGLHGLYGDNFTFLLVGLPSGLFPSGFRTNALYAFLSS